jgi:hypothetical protein
MLDALASLDADAAVALMAPECRFLAADGRRAEGVDAVRALLADHLSVLRSTAYRITAQWHQDDAWIAEVEADYELKDWLQVTAVPRALVVREGPAGVTDLHVYGAHERPLADHGSASGGIRLGGRWMPPL